jgi:putative proteasome-type protease
MELPEQPYDRLFKIVNAFSSQIRRASAEDREALESSGTRFSINVLLGGWMPADGEPKLYQIYPEANWVEIGPGTPYHIIGAGGYGKPVLDRALKYEDTLRFALQVGCLAFDSTRISASDVGFPIDVVVFDRQSGKMVERRYEEKDFKQMSKTWQERLRTSIHAMDTSWVDSIFDQFSGGTAFSETKRPAGDPGKEQGGETPCGSSFAM